MMRQEQGIEVGELRQRRTWGLAMFVACLATIGTLFAATAQASVISVGSVLPEGFAPKKFERVQTLFNTTLPEPGATLASPVSGAIVRWRVQGAKGGPFYLRVLRPNGKGAYEAVGKSTGVLPSGLGLQTFETNLKIQAGDLIGIDPSSEEDEIGVKTESGASYASLFPTPFDGSVVAPSKTFSGDEIELSAEVQPAPEVSLISPGFGSINGGTIVTITGKNLSGASAVKFGDVPAANVTVDSDTQITATAPRGSRPGKST